MDAGLMRLPPTWSGRTMKLQMSIDRFEGDKKQIAVLLADDGTQVNVPKGLLPRGVEAGDILSISIEKDAGATRKVAAETHEVQEELKGTDSGGDIKL
jgi:hypothetical protein